MSLTNLSTNNSIPILLPTTLSSFIKQNIYLIKFIFSFGYATIIPYPLLISFIQAIFSAPIIAIYATLQTLSPMLFGCVPMLKNLASFLLHKTTTYYNVF